MSAEDKRGKPGIVAELFPFTEYFADAPQPLFKSGASYEDDMEVGQTMHITKGKVPHITT